MDRASLEQDEEDHAWQVARTAGRGLRHFPRNRPLRTVVAEALDLALGPHPFNTTARRLARSVRAFEASALARALILPALLVATFSIGIALRALHLGSIGLNSDEVVYSGQAAALADVPELSDIFPLFRAHPMLFQLFISVGYLLGVGSVFGRFLAAGFGIATVYLVYKLGSLLYGRKSGAIAALFMALMPYHVIVSRQALLDAPLALFSTLSMYCLARYAHSGRAVWLYTTGAAMGLTFLSKEPGILLLGAIYAFFALSPSARFRIKDLVLSIGVMLLVIAPFPLSMVLSQRTGTGQSYLVWQLLRRPNHDWLFYPSTVPEAMGPLLILVALAGLWLLRRHTSWRETLLLSWIVVPLAFFQLWPVKGYQYLLPIAPAVVILAARPLGSLASQINISLRDRRVNGIVLAPLVAVIVAASLMIPSWGAIESSASDGFLAGSGGVPGGREAGEWLRANAPADATLLTLGPSMANILEFYGHRRAYGLSVSPNPLHRNPSYEPVLNPDFSIRSSEIQYVVWDAFSASRSSHFSDKILGYVDRYKGRAVHTETISVETADGAKAEKPAIIIYEVRP